MTKDYTVLPLLYLLIILAILFGYNSQAQIVSDACISMHGVSKHNLFPDAKDSLISVNSKGGNIIIERAGEMLMLNKEKMVDHLNSEMIIEETANGEQVLLVQTRIVLNDNMKDDLLNFNKSSLEIAHQTSGYEYLRFYPNPTKDFVNVNFKFNDAANTSVQITNILGQVLFEDVRKGFNEEYKRNIDLSNFSRGTYILNIHHGDRVVAKKLIVE